MRGGRRASISQPNTRQQAESLLEFAKRDGREGRDTRLAQRFILSLPDTFWNYFGLFWGSIFTLCILHGKQDENSEVREYPHSLIDVWVDIRVNCSLYKG